MICTSCGKHMAQMPVLSAQNVFIFRVTRNLIPGNTSALLMPLSSRAFLMRAWKHQSWRCLSAFILLFESLGDTKKLAFCSILSVGNPGLLCLLSPMGPMKRVDQDSPTGSQIKTRDIECPCRGV